MRGRKPKDCALKLVTGNPGRRPLPNSGGPFVAGPIDKPADLDAYASTEWDRLADALGSVLNASCRGILLVAVNAYAQMMQADAVIRKSGLTYQTSSREAGIVIRQRPEVRIRDAARAAYHRALMDLGASPVARTRVRNFPDRKAAKPTGTGKFFT